MKKFITYISQLPEKALKKGKYTAVSNEKLDCDSEVSFPVLPIINGYAQDGDEIEIIALFEKNNENCKRNYEVLKEETEELSRKNNFKYSFKNIEVSGEEVVKEHLAVFEKILNEINDGDKLYVCATYGTKPIPIVEMMAVNAAYKIKKGILVECVAYGRAVREKGGEVKELLIYDITPLLFMTRLVDTITQNPLENPLEVIRRVLEEDNEAD